ncbi:MAG: RNA-binding S4 domain-containing protein [Nocardioides sp.]
MTSRSVGIDGDSIRLGQFLKLADMVDSGSDAKPAILAGEVTVNGEVERRRGRQLAKGDVVGFADGFAEVVDRGEFEDNLPW